MAPRQRGRKKRPQGRNDETRPQAGSRSATASNGGQEVARRGWGPAVRSRAWMIAAAVLLVPIAGVFGWKLIGARGPAGRRSPIILISIDTLRADRLPAYGYGKIRTPAIDELARNGTVFDNCYTHVPLTLPAHTSILTGLLPGVHGVRDNLGFKVANGARTLAGELKKAGYSTGAAVSAYVLHSSTGISQGFDWYDDQFKAAAVGTPLTDVRRDGMETLSRALAWLAGRSNASGSKPDARDPVFLFVHFYEPHAPYTPPARFRRGDTSPYDGTVMYSDEIVGALFAGLRKLDLYDPSLIILLSDHGEGLDDHGEATHGVLIYREVMHVPLVIKLPGEQAGGRRVAAPVQLIDIAPTVLEWAGLPAIPQTQGQSLLPALRAREFPGDRRIYGESLYGRLHFGWKELFSLTSSQYNFILAPREELYDVRRDPGETHNLLARGAAAAATDAGAPAPVALERDRMRKELTSYVGQSGPASPSPVDEEQLKKLRALGYVGSPTLDTSRETAAPDPKDRIGDLALYQQATRMKSAYLFSRAAKALRDVLKTSPGMIDAWDQLSKVDQHLGRSDEAVQALKESLRIAPQRTAQRFELVDLLVQLKRFDEARAELSAAAPGRPDEAEVRRAFLELAAGRPDAAREAAARAAHGLPAAAPFIEGLVLYGKQEFGAAVRSLEQALAGLNGRSPDALPYVHYYLGDALARESQTVADQTARARSLKAAEEHLAAELALRPTNAAAATSLCFAHALGRDLKKVDAGLNEFARQNPSAGTYQLIAQLYGSMRLNDRAAQWSEKARVARANPDPTQ